MMKYLHISRYDMSPGTILEPALPRRYSCGNIHQNGENIVAGRFVTDDLTYGGEYDGTYTHLDAWVSLFIRTYHFEPHDFYVYIVEPLEGEVLDYSLYVDEDEPLTQYLCTGGIRILEDITATPSVVEVLESAQWSLDMDRERDADMPFELRWKDDHMSVFTYCAIDMAVTKEKYPNWYDRNTYDSIEVRILARKYGRALMFKREF